MISRCLYFLLCYGSFSNGLHAAFHQASHRYHRPTSPPTHKETKPKQIYNGSRKDLNHNLKLFALRGGDLNSNNNASSFDASAAAAYCDLPDDIPFRNDLVAAIRAVRRACIVTCNAQKKFIDNSSNNGISQNPVATLIKADDSPVTIADFASQAMVLESLHRDFATDLFIAEETSDTLKNDDDVLKQVMELTDMSESQLFESIDLGRSGMTDTSLKNGVRIWTCDPIDGTKGFLRGWPNGQYCVALALIEGGEIKAGVLGCPNLRFDDHNNGLETSFDDNNNIGVIFFASKDGGAYQIPCFSDNMNDITKIRRIEVTTKFESEEEVKDARFCLGVESFGNTSGEFESIAKIIHGRDTALDAQSGEIIKARRMDSQAKYGVLARGGGEVFLRFPKKGYQEWIWDVAPGTIVLSEAGGKVTDVNGKNISFRFEDTDFIGKLPKSVNGIIATNGGLCHEEVLKAYRGLKM